MMHDEFITLSGVTVSLRYYQDVIEPDYIAEDVDKTVFCENWIKRNKSLLCKAVTNDINSLSRKLYIVECNKAQAARAVDELSAERSAKEVAEYELRQARARLEELEWQRENLAASARKNHDTYDRLMADYNELLSIKATVAAKDAEIIKLKAALYDLTAQRTQ